MKKLVLFSALLTGISAAYAQPGVNAFLFHGNVYELNLTDSSEIGISGVPIEVWSGDQLVSTEVTGPKGKYNLSLPRYAAFTLKFGRAPFVTKVIEIDTKGIERVSDLSAVDLKLEISLFKDMGYLGMNFMNYTPVAIAKFNKRSGNLEWNSEYAREVNERLSGVLLANGK